jgi:hypothetical protein
MDVQPDQLPLLYVLSQRPLSVPRTKTAMVPEDGDAAAGDEVSTPPRFSQPDHDVPLYHL